MMSNFYNPWLSPYTQSPLAQYLLHSLLYPQLFPSLSPLDSLFLQNQLQQNFIISRESAKNQQKFPIQQVKFQSKQQNQQENSNILVSLHQQKQEIDDAKTRQKYGRNITSNIFRSLLKRLSNPTRFKKLFHQIVEQKKLHLSYQNFLQQIDKLSSKLKSYVKRNQMRRFFFADSNQKQRQQFCLVFRIMSKVYFREQHTISIFHSKKINKQSRNLHFVLLREMETLFK